MAEKTLVLKVQVEEPVKRVLGDYSEACARWLDMAFRLLYSDKRHHGSKVYSGLVTLRTRKDGTPTGKFWTDDSAIYKTLVSRKAAPNPIPTVIAHRKNVQSLSKKLITVWGGFLGPSKDRAVPRPKGRLPRFRPACYIGQQMARLEDDGMTISIPYPLSYGREKGKAHRICVTLVPSTSPKYKVRLDAFRHRMKKQQRSGNLTAPSFEIRQHEGGEWYIHVPVEDERPQVNPTGKALGVDLGERNTATTALVSGAKGQALIATKLYSGLSTRHALDLITARRRKLRRKLDTGSRGVRKALGRLRGKMARVNDTLAQQASAAIVKSAVEIGVSLIAVEDLRGGFRPLHKRGEEPGLRTKGIRKWNHRLGRWNRGAVRDNLTYKAEASGIPLKEVFARGTSSICPNCHPTGWLADGEQRRGRRHRKGHVFRCKTCGYSRNDDETGAINIAHRGLNKSPRRASHNPTPGSDAEGGGSGVRKGAGGDSCQPQKPREEEGEMSSPATVPSSTGTRMGQLGLERYQRKLGTVPVTSPRSAKVQSAEGSPDQKPERLNVKDARPGGDNKNSGQVYGRTCASTEVVTPSRGASRTDVKLPGTGVLKGYYPLGKVGCSKVITLSRRRTEPAVAMAGDLGGHGRSVAFIFSQGIRGVSQWLETWVDMAGALSCVFHAAASACRNGWRPGWTWQVDRCTSSKTGPRSSQWLETWVDMAGVPFRPGYSILPSSRNGWRPGWTWQGGGG